MILINDNFVITKSTEFKKFLVCESVTFLYFIISWNNEYYLFCLLFILTVHCFGYKQEINIPLGLNM